MASGPWNASPYGRTLVSGHWTASHGRVWHDCWVHFNLRQRWPSSDLDAGEAALWNGHSDGHHVPAKSDQGKNVPWTAFSFGLPSGKSLAPGPAFAAACHMRMGEASWEAIITSGLAAAVCCPVHP